jgi:hypothetical protein
MSYLKNVSQKGKTRYDIEHFFISDWSRPSRTTTPTLCDKLVSEKRVTVSQDQTRASDSGVVGTASSVAQYLTAENLKVVRAKF